MARLIDVYGPSLPTSCPLLCTDYAPGMINQVAKARENQEPAFIWARVDARVLDALDLKGIADNSLSHVAAGLVSTAMARHVSNANLLTLHATSSTT